MNTTPVGLAQVQSAKGVAVELPCPHCDYVVRVPANGETQEAIDALAAWRLADHLNTAHADQMAACHH